MAVKKSTSKMKRKSGNGKSAASKTTAKKMPTVKMPTVKDAMSKSGMIKTITDVTCLTKKDVVAVLDCLTQVIEKHVKSGGPGLFVMPGLMKISVVMMPAQTGPRRDAMPANSVAGATFVLAAAGCETCCAWAPSVNAPNSGPII